MNRKFHQLIAWSVRILTGVFLPVLMLFNALGTCCFWARSFFFSGEEAGAMALRLDFTAAGLASKQPRRSCSLYLRATIAAKRSGDTALQLQTYSYAADHFFACQHFRSARRAARRALALATARCGEPLQSGSTYYEDSTVQSLLALINRCDWMIKGKEARSYEQSAESCLAEGKHMHAATMFRVAAESAVIRVGRDSMPVALLYSRQAEALLDYHQYAQAIAVLKVADRIASEWLEPANPQRRRMIDNLLFALRSFESAEDARGWKSSNERADDGYSGFGTASPYGS